jgi:hypothetical protein
MKKTAQLEQDMMSERQKSIGNITAWLRRQKNRFYRRNADPPSEDKDRLQMMYFGSAIHYHVAARYAVVAAFLPEAGNLVHHAIEFYLKGALIKSCDEQARRQMHHDLRKAWRRYKRERKDRRLRKFDETIRDVNKFERIRYPEEILRFGMLAEIGFVRNAVPAQGHVKSPPGERYQLALEEVDELAKLIFQIEDQNPAFYTNRLNEHAKRYLDFQNKSPL